MIVSQSEKIARLSEMICGINSGCVELILVFSELITAKSEMMSSINSAFRKDIEMKWKKEVNKQNEYRK